MECDVHFNRPASLRDGMKYWLAERNEASNQRIFTPVTLITYDPSPAFVIVKTGAGMKIRCLREDIFTGPEGWEEGSVGRDRSIQDS